MGEAIKHSDDPFTNFTKINEHHYLENHFYKNGTFLQFEWKYEEESVKETLLEELDGIGSKVKHDQETINNTIRHYVPKILHEFVPNVPDEDHLNMNYVFTIVILVTCCGLAMLLLCGFMLLKKKRRHPICRVNVINNPGSQERLEMSERSTA